MAIQVDADTRRLTIDTCKVNLSLLQAMAISNTPEGVRARWRVVYKNTVVAELRLHTKLVN